MTDDSPARAEARAAVEKALIAFLKVHRSEVDPADQYHGEEPILLNWAACLEYTSVGLERDDRQGMLRVLPVGQARSTTLGLLEDSRMSLLGVG